LGRVVLWEGGGGPLHPWTVHRPLHTKIPPMATHTEREGQREREVSLTHYYTHHRQALQREGGAERYHTDTDTHTPHTLTHSSTGGTDHVVVEGLVVEEELGQEAEVLAVQLVLLPVHLCVWGRG
jgi:hypothetical protein